MQPANNPAPRVGAPGTIEYEAIQYLRENGATTLSVLSIGIGRNFKRLASQLSCAVDAGLLTRTERGATAVYEVGPSAVDLTRPIAEEDHDERTVTRVSAASVNSIFAYAKARNAAPFSCAMHTDGRLSIERHGRVVCELSTLEREIVRDAASRGVPA